VQNRGVEGRGKKEKRGQGKVTSFMSRLCRKRLRDEYWARPGTAELVTGCSNSQVRRLQM
jgi:hypothetical protein